MSLLELPNEVLQHIVHYLGIEFFKEDTGRLTICKTWYFIAQGELWSEVAFLTPHGIRYLASKLYDNSAQNLPAWAPTGIRSLTLHLHGLKLCSEYEKIEYTVSEHPHSRLHRALHEVALQEQHRPFQLLQELRHLRKFTLSIGITGSLRWSKITDCEYAAYSAVKLFGQLALPSLRELNLTLMGALAFTGHPDEPYRQHMCTAINEVLINLCHLREVHLTLEYVCQCLFTAGQANHTMALQTLYLNCSVEKDREVNRDTSDECYCCEGRDLRVQSYQQRANRRMKKIGAAATKFANALESPGTFRIIWPNQVIDSAAVLSTFLGREPPIRMSYAWDCLSGEAHTFIKGESWDSEGTLIDLDQDFVRSKEAWKPLRNRFRRRFPATPEPRIAPYSDSSSDSGDDE